MKNLPMKNLPLHFQLETVRMSLGAILDAIDYTAGNCRPASSHLNEGAPEATDDPTNF